MLYARVLISNNPSNSEDKVLVILSDKRLTALEDKNYEEVDIYKNRIIKTGIDVQISKDTIKLVPNSSFDRVALRELVDE